MRTTLKRRLSCELFALLLISSCAAAGSNQVQSELHDSIPSPDKRLTAVTRVDYSGAGFGTDIMTESVFLQRELDKKNICEVILIELNASPYGNITMKWDGPAKLLIGFKRGSLDYQVVKCQGVDITTAKINEAP